MEASDSLPVFEFIEGMNSDSFINHVFAKTGHSKCSTLYTKMNIGLEKPITVAFEAKSKDCIHGCGINSIFEILLTDSNHLLVEGRWCNLDQLKYQIALNLTNHISFDNKSSSYAVVVSWGKSTDMKALKRVLRVIYKGQMMVVNDRAVEYFNKQTCNLDSMELKSFMKNRMQMPPLQIYLKESIHIPVPEAPVYE